MEKKAPILKPPYEKLIPDKKQAARASKSFTEEELIRNEAYFGVKKQEPKPLATVHSIQEAQARKTAKQKQDIFLEASVVERIGSSIERAIEDIQKEIDVVGADPALNTLEKNKRLIELDIKLESIKLKELKGSEPEKNKLTGSELREARKKEEEGIENIAKGVFEARMRGDDAETIDKMLIEKGIKPWTPEAEEFMRAWDWEQAEQTFRQLAQEREETVVKANEAEPKKHIELGEKQSEYIDTKFAAFNINPDSLPKELKEDYETLTYGQRLLIAENLQQLTLGRVQEEALQKYHDDTRQSKFLGKIWKGITKKYQIAGHEQVTALAIKTGGLEYHGELLKQLVDGTKRTGLDAIEGRDGVLELQYVEAHPLMTEAQKEGAKTFNRVATVYSKIPYEWSLASATSAQKSEYARMEGQFKEAKERVLKTEEGILGDRDSLLFMSETENKIRLNQFLNTHPDAEKQLQSIESDTVWKKAMGDIATERGLYFGAGLATRTFATGLLGAVGFPLAAMGMGGWMARRRAVETLRQRGVESRHGKKDVSSEAANTVTADGLFKKLEGLVQKINSEENDTKRTELLSLLQVRLEYTQNKINNGLVDFGSADRRIVNQYGLMDMVNTGTATFAVLDIEQGNASGEEKKNVKERLDQFLQFKDAKISKAQKDYLRKQMIYGAGLGVAAFSAGYYVKEILHTVSPTEAYAGTSGIKETTWPPLPKTIEGASPVPSHTAPLVTIKEAHVAIPGGGTGKDVSESIESLPGGDISSSLEKGAAVAAAEHGTAPAGAAKAVAEAAPAREAFHDMVDIGKRGPEGAFIDELKKHPEIVERLGIKDPGKAAHAAWTEFAKTELKDPETIELLKERGFSPDAKGYAEMMHRIANGKIILEESKGKLHMRISQDDTEYLQARPKVTVSKITASDSDIPTGPQVFGGTAEEMLKKTPEDMPTGPQIFGDTVLPTVEKAPVIDVNAAFRKAPLEGITSPVPRVELGTFVSDQFGLDGAEYNAIKGVQVEKLLKQIPSRDEAWAIWRGEVPGKEITLPNDGIYGAIEFKKHIDLAEHIRALHPNDAAMKTDVDTFMKAEISGKGLVHRVETPAVGAEHVTSLKAEAHSAVAATHTENIPTKPQGVEVVPEVSVIKPERFALLKDDIYGISNVPIRKIITQYKVGNFESDDFANYYALKVDKEAAGPLLKASVKQMFEKLDHGNVAEQTQYGEGLGVMIKQMRGIK